LETVRLLVVDHVHPECRLARCVLVVGRLLVVVSAELLAVVAHLRTRWVAAAGLPHGSRTLVLALLPTVEAPLTVARAVSVVPHLTEVRQVMVAAPATAAVRVTVEEEAHGVVM
jgi:hypothetical protein